MSNSSPQAGPSQPTNTRYWVIFCAATLSVITYIDRVSISQAVPLITEELGLTRVQMGWAFSAFSLGYFLLQVPGDWMSDWIGSRRVLTSIVVWWSVFTAATGLAFSPRHADWSAATIWRGTGRRVSGLNENLHHLASPARAYQGARNHVDECSLGRRFFSAAGGCSSSIGFLAPSV